MLGIVAAILANLTVGGLGAAVIEGGVGRIGSYGVGQAFGWDQPQQPAAMKTVYIERHYYHYRCPRKKRKAP